MISPKTLILEDDPDLIFLFSSVLQNAGYEVFSAATVFDAYPLLSKHHFDLLVCDMNLGTDLIVELIHDHFDRLDAIQTRIVGISSLEQHRAVCANVGAEIFLSKPVRLNELIILVDQLGGTQQRPRFSASAH